MSRLLLLVTLLFTSTASFANSQWKVVAEQRLQGTTPEEIRQILDQDQANRFEWLRRAIANASLVGLLYPKVIGLNVLVKTIHWEGDSLCDANDPRLTRQIEEGAIYYATGQNSTWSQTAVESDPCALGFTEPARVFLPK